MMAYFNYEPWQIAEGKLEKEAKDCINDACKYLAKIVIDRCDGTEDYTFSQIQHLKEALAQLMKIEDML